MASVNQTRPHCVNQMGKTHSKPLAARHGRGTAWARQVMSESAFRIASAFLDIYKIAHSTTVLSVVKQLVRPRRRWEDNIKMDLQEVGCGGMDWIEVAQDRDSWRTLVNEVMNIRVP